MTIFNELKRRNVFRVGAAYLVVAWLVLQVIDTVGPIINLSDGFSRGVLLVLVIGFPLALIVSWIFELTPQGLQTQAAADQAGMHTSKSRLNAVIIGGLALALVLVVLDAYVLDGGEAGSSVQTVADSEAADDEITQTTGLAKSIAVLPFADLSPEGDQEYFADGLSEEILNRLAQVDALQVTARTSSFYFKGRNETMQEIGEQLGVNYLLEGSVRKSGNNLRITAQLIEADTGFHLWSENFDQELADVFAIQDEIAGEVTQALQVTLGAGYTEYETRNAQAFDLAMQAMALNNTATTDNVRQGIALMERSLSLDDQAPLQWIRMARFYVSGLSRLPPRETGDYDALRLEALARARELAPDWPYWPLFDAADAIGQGDWLTADEYYMAGLEANARDQGALVNYSGFLWTTGRIREAAEFRERARRLDPLNPNMASALAFLYLMTGDFDRSEAERNRAVELGYEAPAYLFGQWAYQTFLEQGDVQKASDYLVSATDPEINSGAWREQFFPGLPDSVRQKIEAAITAELFRQPEMQLMGVLGNLLMMEDRAQAVTQFNDLLARMPVGQGYLSTMAEFAVALGEQELALSIFRDNESAQNSSLVWFGHMSPVRLLPEFKDYLAETGLSDYWRTTGNWPDMCRPLEGNDDFECF